MKVLPLDRKEKISYHISAVFGIDVSDQFLEDLQIKFSRRTGRIKNFSIGKELVATMRTDGGLALTVFGARELIKNKQFRENCVIPTNEAIPFVSEGKSLFCKHVDWCGPNVKAGLDVAIIDKNDHILATGKALFGCNTMKKYSKGMAVKVREGIKSRVK